MRSPVRTAGGRPGDILNETEPVRFFLVRIGRRLDLIKTDDFEKDELGTILGRSLMKKKTYMGRH